jgi:hypothetical protein
MPMTPLPTQIEGASLHLFIIVQWSWRWWWKSNHKRNASKWLIRTDAQTTPLNKKRPRMIEPHRLQRQYPQWIEEPHRQCLQMIEPHRKPLQTDRTAKTVPPTDWTAKTVPPTDQATKTPQGDRTAKDSAPKRIEPHRYRPKRKCLQTKEERKKKDVAYN